MGISSLFQRYPLLLPSISLITGICWGKKIFFSGWIIYSPSGFPLCLLFLLFLLFAYSLVRYNQRWIYGFFICLFFLALGATLSLSRLERIQTCIPSVATCYRVRLVSSVMETPNACKVEALLLAKGDSIGLEQMKNSRVQLFFEKDSSLSDLHCDDELLIHARINYPVAATNDEVFDYGKYLLFQGFSGVGYVKKGDWDRLDTVKKPSLKAKSLACQRKIVNQYKKWDLNEEAYVILSALTIGYREDLTSGLRSSFSSAGVGHILALSGLHIGFIAMFFHFFIVRIGRRSRILEISCKLVLLCALWGFSFVVGSTSSVIRSVFMFSLLILSSLFLRKSDSRQNLCVTLFIMLLYNPLWLFDVGFQLSFVAVLSILMLMPVVQPLIPFRSRILRFFANVALLSVVAQLGVLPLILYYFGSFPTYFLLGNLWVIPLVTLILYLAFLGLLTFCVPMMNAIFVFLLNKALNGVLLLVRGVEQLPYSTVDHLWIEGREVFLLYVLLSLLILLLYKPKFQHLFAFLSSMILFLSLPLYNHYATPLRSRIVFYNVRNCPAIHCIDSNSESYLTLVDGESNPEKLVKTMDRHWSLHHLHPQCIKDSCYQNALFYNKPLLVFHNYKVAVLDTALCCKGQPELPYKVDLIYLCKGFRGSLTEVLSVFSSSTLVLDASLPYYLQNRMEVESRKRGMQCIPLSIEGSCSFSI